ncbi:hypothetical protein CD30_06235 [Ureibacillus massiliensis 4400831 = CIP 108448 = CCUG 49529]|uniref:DUF1294 domain-containing protein n=1 Tax=Ureibacillus massiliensis 4400831 = CIP 108448 = CCUG 49529 TaxID=1211035 RepID=A0A0A3JWN5_9BACL|nr:DUF1294 domain-containing protein [Ureibacillus massiliensis]KGR91412.1 hypothetical protein CD30_06235 [Ureibacillus massiliensis 4400831 = CIP 108448 = CCUG 49529]BDH62552.1 membrane protein [Lysinibacillus sp. PLM2]
MWITLLAFMIVESIFLLALMGIDKSRAKKHEWRISEKTLFTIAIFGGACGGVLGMYLFRHKTRHNAFAFGFPLIAAIHIFILVKLYS